MITAFTIKNFKAIGEEPVRIELKPITLLFGANSAGKSSILHALNYAYSVFVDHNLNAEYNIHSDSNFNLGGFKRFVHRSDNGDKKNSILLRFELDFQINEIPNPCSRDDPYFYERDEEYPYLSIDMLKPKKILKDVTKAYVAIEISWSDNQKCPYVSSYETGLNGIWIARIDAEGYKKKVSIRHFNVAHPIFNDLWTKYGILMDWLVRTCVESKSFVHNFSEHQYRGDKQDEICEYNPEHRSKILEDLGCIPVSDRALSKNLNIILSNQSDALPDLSYAINIPMNVWNKHDNRYYEPSEFNHVKFGGPYYENVDGCTNSKKNLIKRSTTTGSLIIAFEDLLNSILVAPRLKITKWLRSICHLGPLREIPSRNFAGDLEDRIINHWRWEKGIAAWDKLYQIGQLQLDQSKESYEDVSAWLNENFEKYFDKIRECIKSDPNIEEDFDKVKVDLDDPDFSLFYENRIKKDEYLFLEDIERTLEIYNVNKYLNDLPADDLVNLDLLTKISNLKQNADRPLHRINDWLSSSQRLNTGYDVQIERYREISSEDFIEINNGKLQAGMAEIFKKILSNPEKIRIWLRDKSRNINLSPHEIGTGISQVLPVVVAAVGTEAQLVAIEQPELHIHPALQVRLGDLFIEQSNDQKFFLIETHSEHLLLRIMRRIRETAAEENSSNTPKIWPHEVAIYYVESENGITQVNHIGLDENGRFTDRWPRGFFAERMHEMLPSDIRERVEAKRLEEK